MPKIYCPKHRGTYYRSEPSRTLCEGYGDSCPACSPVTYSELYARHRLGLDRRAVKACVERIAERLAQRAGRYMARYEATGDVRYLTIAQEADRLLRRIRGEQRA